MRSTVILIFVLTLVCLISALALALVNNLTEDRIIEQKRLAELRAVVAALTCGDFVCDNDPSEDIMTIPGWNAEDGVPSKLYQGKHNGKVEAIAFTSIGEGYSGYITIMMGVKLTGELTGIEILGHLETPGLGANIEKANFKNQFIGKSPKGSPEGKMTVIKARKADKNWEIEALTGATVSPRGVVEAINHGLAMFEKYKVVEAISKGGTQ